MTYDFEKVKQDKKDSGYLDFIKRRLEESIKVGDDRAHKIVSLLQPYMHFVGVDIKDMTKIPEPLAIEAMRSIEDYVILMHISYYCDVSLDTFE